MASGDVRGVTRQMESLNVGKSTKLISNACEVVPLSSFPIYQYHVEVVARIPNASGQPSEAVISRPTKLDHTAIQRKNACTAAFVSCISNKYLPSMEDLIYDRAGTLFSRRDLKLGSGKKSTFIIDRSNIFNEAGWLEAAFGFGADEIKFTVIGAEGNPVFKMGDLLTQEKKRFIELLTSQKAFFPPGNFTSFSASSMYLNHPEQYNITVPSGFSNHLYVGFGVAKGVRVIDGKGDNESNTAGLFIDMKVTPFHNDNQSVLEKVAAVLDISVEELNTRVFSEDIIRKLSAGLKGLELMTTYTAERTGRVQVFICQGISQTNAQAAGFEVGNRKMSVKEYYMEHYQYEIVNPLLPLVMGPRGTLFPMELLVVADNQRATNAQMGNAVEKLIRVSAVSPSVRQRHTNSLVNALDMAGDTMDGGNWSKRYHFNISNFLKMEGRVLNPPSVMYGGTSRPVRITAERGTWKAARDGYLVPASCENWCMIALIAADDKFSPKACTDYCDAFVKACRERGMKMGDPKKKYVKDAKEEDVRQWMQIACDQGSKFIHFITSDKLRFHDAMKLEEVRFGSLVTQDLKSRTASSAPMQRQTMENIVNKTNVKLGGINYNVILSSSGRSQGFADKDRLFIGIESAVLATSEAEKTCVIGYSWNSTVQPLGFIGGYRFGNANDAGEIVDSSLGDVIVEILTKFEKLQKHLPRNVMVFRYGLPENRDDYIMNKEGEEMKKAVIRVCSMKRVEPSKLTLVSVTKMHNARFYRETSISGGKIWEENIEPGTVVDTVVVNKSDREFFMCTHSAFQGTAKVPLYRLLRDEVDYPVNEVIGVAHALAFDYQIVSMSVSLPAPVFVAHMMLKRGRANYNILGGSNMDVEQVNEELSYAQKPLGDVRFNA